MGAIGVRFDVDGSRGRVKPRATRARAARFGFGLGQHVQGRSRPCLKQGSWRGKASARVGNVRSNATPGDGGCRAFDSAAQGLSSWWPRARVLFDT